MQRHLNYRRSEKGARRFNALRADQGHTPVTEFQFATMSATRLMAKAEVHGLMGERHIPDRLVTQGLVMGLFMTDLIDAAKVGLQIGLHTNPPCGPTMALRALRSPTDLCARLGHTPDQYTYPYRALRDYPLSGAESTVAVVRTATLQKAVNRLQVSA